MGLDTSHNCYHGSYGVFHEWRKFIADKIGINLENMEGFSRKEFPIKWSIYKDNDLTPLLSHDDNEGILTPEEAARTAAGLKAILDQMKETDPFYKTTKRFMDGCLDAAAKNEEVDFH